MTFLVARAYIQPRLIDNLKVQYRVIRALMLRQILLRWGRNNLGYLWLFIEPLIFIAVIVAFVSITNGNGFEKVHVQFSIVPFLFLGVSQAMIWRFVSHKCGNAFSGNIPLLEHRNIRPIDLFLSTALVEILGVTAAFVGIYGFLLILGLLELPENIPLMIFGWVLLVWFGLAYGVFFGALSGAFDFIDFAMRGINFGLYISSGVFFAVVWLPIEYRSTVLWLPMIHGTEMMRHAYYGQKLITFEDPFYFICFNILFSFMALLIARASWLEDIRE